MSAENRPDEVEQSDADLVKRLRSDPDAYGPIHQRYNEPLYRYVLHKVGNPHDAEDITQGVHLKVFRRIHMPNDPSREFIMRDDKSLKYYLYRCAHNEIADLLRDRSRHRSLPLDDLPEAYLWISTYSDPQEEAEKEEEKRILREVMAELYEGDLEVIMLRDIKELPFAKVGKIMGVSKNTAKVQHFRAIKRLRGVFLGGNYG